MSSIHDPLTEYTFSGRRLVYTRPQRASALLADLRRQGLLPEDRPQVICGMYTWRPYYLHEIVAPGHIAAQEGTLGAPDVPWYYGANNKPVHNLLYAGGRLA